MAIAALILFAWTRGGNEPPSTLQPTSDPTTTTATTVPPTTLPDGNSVATATVPLLAVFDDPSTTTPTLSFENPWLVNGDANAAVPLVFLVKTQRQDGWIQVLLPTRPNGSVGWVHATDVNVTTVAFHITISRHDHHLTVFRGHDVVLEDTVAVGAPDTPTPTGVFFIRALLKAPNPNTVYGPFAYGLSGFSETLQHFDGGDAEVGIHGNNDASVLGHDITHGCIRMSNEGISRLATLLPLGTPVQIDP
jgi:lipoprotein-anchoring transpeptidase ErfK/SrfK